MRRIILAIAVSVVVMGGSASDSAAQELPTGAGRVVEKVQTRIFISTAMLKYHVEAILANQPALPTSGK
jgi:hypothetical protein